MKLAHCNGLQRANPNIQRLLVFPGGGAAYLIVDLPEADLPIAVMPIHTAHNGVFFIALHPGHRALIFLKMHADAINITRPVLRHIGCGEGEHACRESDEIDEYLFSQADRSAFNALLYLTVEGGLLHRQRRLHAHRLQIHSGRVRHFSFLEEYAGEMPPDAIPCFLLADFGTVDDQLRIVIFENNAELGEHSIRSVCVFCAAALPEAIAVACAGVEVSIGRIIGMDRCRLLHPPGGNDLLALINAVLRIAERKLCKILHREHQTPAADFHAMVVRFPIRHRDPQWFIEPRR